MQDNPIWNAAKDGDFIAFEHAIRQNPHLIDTPNAEGRTPMYFAAHHGRVSIIETLMQLGCKTIDTAITSDSYWTPMHVAADRGDASVIEILMRSGCTTIDALDRYGRTPLYLASMQENTSAIETLLRLGSQAIDIPEDNGTTPLDCAACFSSTSFRALKMLGANHLKLMQFDPDIIDFESIALMNKEIDENESAGLRRRVYFQQSLSGRLLSITTHST